MNVFDQPYYKITKNFASLIGRWPYQSQKQSSIIITIVWIVFFLQAIPQSIALVMHADDREVFIEGISTFAVDIVVAAKFLNATYHAKLIRDLFDKVQRDWKLVMNDGEKRVLQNHSEIGRLLTAAYAAFLTGTLVTFVMEPIVPRIYSFFSTSNESIPLRFAVPLEYIIFEKENYYWLLVIVTSFFISVFLFGLIACDVLFITLLQHICGQFAVLGYRIENTPITEITAENDKKDLASTQKIDQDVSYPHLVSCIQMHTRAIKNNRRFAELLEECFAMSFGVVVGLNLPMISLTGFQIITQSNTIQQILKGLTFIGGQTLHLFFDCYLSQKLNDSSSQIAQSMAKLDWYKQSIRSKKLLVLMTVRSHVSCKLTAGKIMELSIENFGMLKTAGSYFTMLLSMQ